MVHRVVLDGKTGVELAGDRGRIAVEVNPHREERAGHAQAPEHAHDLVGVGAGPVIERERDLPAVARPLAHHRDVPQRRGHHPGVGAGHPAGERARRGPVDGGHPRALGRGAGAMIPGFVHGESHSRQGGEGEQADDDGPAAVHRRVKLANVRRRLGAARAG